MPNISSELLFRVYQKSRTQEKSRTQGRKKKFIYSPIRKHFNTHLFFLINNMNYTSSTKARLVQLLDIKDKELDGYDDIKEQQTILVWLLFITAGLGFMF